MRIRNKKYYWLLLFLLVIYLFNIFAYEIELVNARIRNWVVTGNTNIRQFDAQGLPVSSNPNIKEEFVSPFYVVHYGLLYSELYNNDKRKNNAFHWRPDSSLKFWNVAPQELKKEYFKHCVEWLIHHIDTSFGPAHFVYDFDWPYRGYPNNYVRKPWWSGLTDAYAIVLMLRAYDIYKDEKYLTVAKALYESSLTAVEKNGSLTKLNTGIWIEEYVDPKVAPDKLAYVLNGMIYATFGIKAYEDKFHIENGYTLALLKSIETNMHLFDVGYAWSNYDLIGNSCNMKYHKIQVALMEELYAITQLPAFKAKAEQWKEGTGNIGLNWVLNAPGSIAKKMYLAELGLLLGCFILAFLFRKKGNG